jgi:hypothetical protein
VGICAGGVRGCQHRRPPGLGVLRFAAAAYRAGRRNRPRLGSRLRHRLLRRRHPAAPQSGVAAEPADLRHSRRGERSRSSADIETHS